MGIVTALAWIFLPTGAALAMSIVSGGVIALVAMSTGNANTAEAD